MTVKKSSQIGIVAATAIVAGNMMGSGIALLPSSLAAIGSITIYSWLIATIGALAMAYVYATLGNRDPQIGGPIAYSAEVAPIFGYQAGLLYFHAGWIGNIAMALAGVDYLSVFFPALTHSSTAALVTIGVIWGFTLVNLFGANVMSRLVTIGITGLLIPVVLTATLGWCVFDPQLFFQNWLVPSPTSGHAEAVFSGVVLCIWSFIGIESASVNAGLVKNPKRTIPIATMIGTALAALVYISSSTVILGMFPASQIAQSGAPFSLALSYVITAFLSKLVSVPTLHEMSVTITSAVSLLTAFACLVSLGSWIMMIAQAGIRAAQNETLPIIFSETNDQGVPVKGMLLLAVFSSVFLLGLMGLSSLVGLDSQKMFGVVASVTVLFTIVPYFYSSLQLIRLLRLQKTRLRKTILPITAALIACMWCFIGVVGASTATLMSAALIFFAVLILYVFEDRTVLEKKMLALRSHKDRTL